MRQLAESQFSDDYEPTMINTVSVTFGMKHVTFGLEILETAGQDEFSSLPKEACIGVHGYMLVFSVGSRDTFNKVRCGNDCVARFASLWHIWVQHRPFAHASLLRFK